MRSSPQAPEHSQCPICRAEVSGNGFCAACGSRLVDSPGEEIRSLNYLLSELTRWEDEGVLERRHASELRKGYEERRANLRAQLADSSKRIKPSAAPQDTAFAAPQYPGQQHSSPGADFAGGRATPGEQTSYSRARPTVKTGPHVGPVRQKPRRALLETLADPHTIRLLLYTGAAMVVVGVIIWLRDILYLKLQEPVVQGTLLVIGTTAVTVSGWLTILRTRLRLTGRALTITGSLLVPVNFWFLVRAGLIDNSGRAWLVCAFCAGLYALTAAFLRERLYVYLSSIAVIATAWAIIYQVEREALGLYALSLMALSIAFLHLAHLSDFATAGWAGRMNEKHAAAELDLASSLDNSSTGNSRLSSDLWRLPLVHVALAGATLTLLFYMPLRLGSSSTDGLMQFVMSEYDSGIAILLFAAGAYASWFTGRHMFVERRALFYTMAALALFWIGFLAADGLRFSGATQLLLLATSALIVALAARSSKPDVWALALQRSSLLVSIALAAIASALLSNSARLTLTDGAILVLLAATYAVSSGPRFCERVAAAILAHASAITASIAFLVALSSLDLRSETLFYAAWALLPFALYAIRRATARFRVEMQLGIPFMRVADFEIVLLVLLISVIAVASSPASQGKILAVENLRGAMLLVLPAAAIYGALRCWYERSFFGAAIIPVALILEALIALRVDAQWFATAAVLTLFPGFVVASRYAYARRAVWLEPSGRAADAVLILASVASIAQASVHLRVSDALLLAPCLAFAAIALSSFAAALSAKNQARIHYFRVGLFALVLAFALACLRAGFDPLGDIEIYTTPIAFIILAVAYLTLRSNSAEFMSDTSVLLWVGSLLFAGPLLLHALQYRLFLGVPAPWRDLTVLCASLALLVFGVVGRMRAPVLVGMASLAVELSALGLTSVDWLQIPLKVYLISTGALILLFWGLLEFRREQILLMRSRLKERRETARERFGEWR